MSKKTETTEIACPTQPLDRRDSLLVVYGVYLVCFALVPAVFIVIFGTVNWVAETNSSRDDEDKESNPCNEGNSYQI